MSLSMQQVREIANASGITIRRASKGERSHGVYRVSPRRSPSSSAVYANDRMQALEVAMNMIYPVDLNSLHG